MDDYQTSLRIMARIVAYWFIVDVDVERRKVYPYGIEYSIINIKRIDKNVPHFKQ